MKKYSVLILMLLLWANHNSLYSQRLVSDNPLHAQTRRNVYISWGDWQPKAKKPWWSGGLNVNPQHEMVWGWTAPAFGGDKTRNKNYQKNDIRPLAPQGKEMKRIAFATMEESYSSKAYEMTKEIENNYMSQLALNEGVLSDADPFYLIYFKRELSFVENFSEYKTTTLIHDQDVYKFLQKNGFVEKFNNSMYILKDRYSIAKSSTIERGQRIIFYHNVLNDYRSELEVFKNHIRSTTRFLYYQKKHNGNLSPKTTNNLDAFKNWSDRDLQIAIKIILDSKYSNK